MENDRLSRNVIINYRYPLRNNTEELRYSELSRSE